MAEEKAVSDEQLKHPEGDGAKPAAEQPSVEAAAEKEPATNPSDRSDVAEPADSVAATDAGETDETSDTQSTADPESEPDAQTEVDEDVNELGFRPDEIVDEDEDEEYEEDEDENASPIEELVDESSVAGGGDDIEMDWYILKVQVNRENSICDTLKRRVKVAGMERFFGEVLVPTEDVREFNKSGKQRIVKRKLYPGYIVVNMAINDDSWFLVRETGGIGDFTGAAGKPAPLSSEEISRIIATTKPETEEDGEETIKTAIPFKLGDRVRVKEGYFQNYEGEVSNLDERNGRITVMINIFGRPNPVELDHWHVEKV